MLDRLAGAMVRRTCTTRWIGPLAAVAFVASCIQRPASRIPPQVVDIRVEPSDSAPLAIARSPIIRVAFDRPLGPLGPDAAWLLSGETPDAAVGDAIRGAAGSATRARQLDADIRIDGAEPNVLFVRPRAAILPGEAFLLVTTSLLTSDDGVRAFAVDAGVTSPWFPFRVASVRACPALAEVLFPSSDQLASSSTNVVVRFDRAVRVAGSGPAARIVDDEGSELASDVAWTCGSPSRGYRCVSVTFRALPSGHRRVTVRLGELRDARGHSPWPNEFAFDVSPDDTRTAPAFGGAVVCADDETSRAPFCLRWIADVLEVRAETTGPASLFAFSGGASMRSPVGTAHRVQLPGLPPRARVSVQIDLLDLRGIRTGTATIWPIETPPSRPSVRITEVLARPRSTGAQEFVEIQNAGTVRATFDGWSLRTPTGMSSLPTTTLGPGQRAVIVGAAFDPRGAPQRGDPAVAPGTMLLRLDTPIASRGLADRGVDVWLADAEGRIVSRAPTGDVRRPPRAGVGLVRADDTLSEDDVAGWAYDSEGGSTPGLPDRI